MTAQFLLMPTSTFIYSDLERSNTKVIPILNSYISEHTADRYVVQIFTKNKLYVGIMPHMLTLKSEMH